MTMTIKIASYSKKSECFKDKNNSQSKMYKIYCKNFRNLLKKVNKKKFYKSKEKGNLSL